VFFLANRVGFPFLGENVLAELGDVCAVHSVDNLDVDSEVAMLRSYAPHVPPAVLRLLCAFFADLRQLVARGELSYPYSLRRAWRPRCATCSTVTRTTRRCGARWPRRRRGTASTCSATRRRRRP
jgi:hypothetical protein